MPEEIRCCVIIPTYNNARTVVKVVQSVLPYGLPVIVVNDGATDDTAQQLDCFSDHPQVTLIGYTPNRGKGEALRKGFACAARAGFTHALTLDADGQHFAGDIPAFCKACDSAPDALLIGTRNLHQENMPAKNTFANRFSNFWFTVQTGRRLSDTQTGYRLYPLEWMQGRHWCCRRYEAELEFLVRLAWRGVRIIEIPIEVYYAPPGQRVSHFRTKDFVRISILNTALTLLALIYGYPSLCIRKLAGKW